MANLNKAAQTAYKILEQMSQELKEQDTLLQEIITQAQTDLKSRDKAVPMVVQKVHSAISNCLLENSLTLSKKNRELLTELMQVATKNGYKIGRPGSII